MIRGGRVEVAAGRRVGDPGGVRAAVVVGRDQDSVVVAAHADVDRHLLDRHRGRRGRPARADRDALHLRAAAIVSPEEDDPAIDKGGGVRGYRPDTHRAAETPPAIGGGEQQVPAQGRRVAAVGLEHGDVIGRRDERIGAAELVVTGERAERRLVRARVPCPGKDADGGLAVAGPGAVGDDQAAVRLDGDAAAGGRRADLEGLELGLRRALDSGAGERGSAGEGDRGQQAGGDRGQDGPRYISDHLSLPSRPAAAGPSRS